MSVKQKNQYKFIFCCDHCKNEKTIVGNSIMEASKILIKKYEWIISGPKNTKKFNIYLHICPECIFKKNSLLANIKIKEILNRKNAARLERL